MEKLKTDELSLGLNQTFRNDLVDNFEKIQKGVDSQADDLNKQILDMLGNVAPQDKNEVTQARIDANGKSYDTLKGREDATQLTAETSLEEERKTSSEVQSARTNAQSITYADLKQRLDNQENDIANSMNAKISQISSVPETFANLSALQSTYPNGKPGLFVTADNGHKYIWRNNTWQDAGVYQGVGLARQSVTMDKIDKVNPSQLSNNFSVISSAKPWSNSIVSVYGNEITLIKETGSTSNNFGIVIPTFLDKDVSASDSLYINFDYINSALATDHTFDLIELWLVSPSNALITKISPTNFYASLTKTSYRLVVPGSTILTAGNSKDINIAIVIHNNNTFKVSNFRSNWDNSDVSVVNNETGNKIVINETRKSSIFPKDYSLVVEDGKVMATPGANRPVIEIPYFGLDLTKPVYFVLETIVDPYSTDNAHYWISKLASTTPQSDIKSGHNVTSIVLYPNELAQKGVTRDGVISMVAGNNDTSKRLIVEHVSISNNPIDGDLSYALKTINDVSVKRNIDKIGQPVKNINSAVSTAINGIDWVTPQSTFKGKDGVLKKINAYVRTAGTYSFKVAQIDQNFLIVNTTSDFTLPLVAGYNEIDVESKNIAIPNESQLFMNVSTANVYSPDATHLSVAASYVRDNSHPTTNPGYSGQMMYDAKVLIPFNYEVINKSPFSSLDDLKRIVNENNKEISELSTTKDSVLVRSPSGKKFRLVVADDGTLSTVSQVPSKVAIFGNSLTGHSATGGFGLAASNENSDWFALVKNYILNANPTAIVDRSGDMGPWEGSVTSVDRQNYFDTVIKPKLSPETDLVIIQALDNVNSSERAMNIYSDSKQLIMNIKKVSPKARVLWIAAWFVSKFPSVDLMSNIKQATSDAGAILVNIDGYADIPGYKSYIGAKITKTDGTTLTVTNSGYAIHPGDQGFRAIADSVISVFGF